jgi:hypothetical protein
MPGEGNLAEAHLAQMRALSGVPEPKADASSASLGRKDNATPTSEPVIGAQGTAPLEEALNRGDRRR